MHAPMVEFEGKTLIMVPQETGRITQPGADSVMLSRREVEAVAAKLERYAATNHPAANPAKLTAYRELLKGG